MATLKLTTLYNESILAIRRPVSVHIGTYICMHGLI